MALPHYCLLKFYTGLIDAEETAMPPIIQGSLATGTARLCG